MKMSHEIKPQSALSFLADELWVYVLGFLSCRDILCCTSVCKVLHQIYMYSSELQYIVELSGQCLLPSISSADDRTPISKRLQRLRDKAHAWLKFDAYAFQTVIPSTEVDITQKYVTGGEHFYLWNYHNNLITISPILSKLSQRTIEHHWSPRALCPFPVAERRNVLMDPAQNLFAIMYTVNMMTYIYLATLDYGCVHPHAAGPALVLDFPVYEWQAKFQCYGRHIALWRQFHTRGVGTSSSSPMWQLQIWDWQHSTTLSSVLSSSIQTTFLAPTSFCFLGNDRLLVVTDDLKLYSIKDMSETPRLLACFLLLFPLVDTEHYLPAMHGSQLRTQAQSMYTSDPEHRLLCLTSSIDKRTICLISTKIFFDIDEATAIMPIPWNDWGPGHVRIVEQSVMHVSITHVIGNRVLLADEMVSKRHGYYKLRMMDFSPLAVTNRRGLGRVVKERSIVTVAVERGPNFEWYNESKYYYSTVETALPYVEVVSDRKISGLLQDVWMDGDRIYLLLDGAYIGGTLKPKLEVIDIY